MSRDDPSDWEAMEAIEPRAGEELERTMARYARVRLEPSPAQTKRARAIVMETAWRSKIDAEPAGRRWRLPFASWAGRRVALAASAAVLAGLLLGSSVFAATRAGGPLYDARIAVENVMLPSDPAARLQAQIANAQMRLAEAYDAEVRGDQGALTAALQAYTLDAGTLSATSGPSAAQALAAIEQHRGVLLSLIGRAPASALSGLDQALSSSDNAIEQLTITDSGQSGGGNGGGGNGGSGGQTGGSGSGGGDQNNATPAPTAAPALSAPPAPTAAPANTPKPDHTPKPGPTPKPAHTPKPAASAAPGGSSDPSPSRQP